LATSTLSRSRARRRRSGKNADPQPLDPAGEGAATARSGATGVAS
jgi:hypothetical protein